MTALAPSVEGRGLSLAGTGLLPASLADEQMLSRLVLLTGLPGMTKPWAGALQHSLVP